MKPINLIVAILVVMNIASLVFCWSIWGRLDHHHGVPPGGPGGPPPTQFIIEGLKLNDSQQKQYLALFDEHRKYREARQNEMSRLRTEVFEQLKTDNPDVKKVDSLTTAIGHEHQLLERNFYDHFKAVKDLCNTDQKKQFNTMTQEIADHLTPKSPPRSGRPPR